MTRRAGLSLTEVLVALFIMAIGLIGILTMFPLGALQMGQALKDDRTTQAAVNADGYMRWYWVQNVLNPGLPGNLSDTDLWNALDNPSSPAPIGGQAVQARNTPAVSNSDSGPSYPVVVDPMGIDRGYTGNQVSWVGAPGGGFPQTRLPRRNLALINILANPAMTPQPVSRPSLSTRTCSLLDGLTYDTSGAGAAASGSAGLVDRDLRYNWLWVLQRPSNSNQKTVNMTVVVFEKRAPGYVPKSRNPETTYTTTTPVPVGSSTISFPPAVTNPSIPPVQKGGWIADVTHLPNNVVRVGNQTTTYTPGVRNCNFYRVVSATTNPVTGGLDVELQEPIQQDSVSGPPPGAIQRTFLVMDGVAEVFKRGTISAGP